MTGTKFGFIHTYYNGENSDLVRKIEVFDSILIQYRYKTSCESLAKANVLGHS